MLRRWNGSKRSRWDCEAGKTNPANDTIIRQTIWPLPPFRFTLQANSTTLPLINTSPRIYSSFLSFFTRRGNKRFLFAGVEAVYARFDEKSRGKKLTKLARLRVLGDGGG